MSEWIKVSDRLPTYRDGKGRDNSVLAYLTDKPDDFTVAGSCSVSVHNVEGWVLAKKCSHWMPLPDAPTDNDRGNLLDQLVKMLDENNSCQRISDPLEQETQ